LSSAGEFVETCASQDESADTMTDRLAALRSFGNCPASSAEAPREACLHELYKRFADEPLALDLWFSVQAQNAQPGALQRVQALRQDPAFDILNPNKVRSLLGVWANRNPGGFHEAGEESYAWLVEQVLFLDKHNPQVASGLLTSLTEWRKHAARRGKLMRAQLERLRAVKGLSKDCYEPVFKALREE